LQQSFVIVVPPVRGALPCVRTGSLPGLPSNPFCEDSVFMVEVQIVRTDVGDFPLLACMFALLLSPAAWTQERPDFTSR
jgi:hypothetical protein